MSQTADTRAQGPLVVAIGGGKGGVGKTLIATNLSTAIARLGFRVIAVDADLGSANLHTMLGVERSSITLHALLEGTINSLEEAVVPTSIPRLFIVPGSDAIPGAANIPHAQKQKLIRHIRKLDADAVVIDCGAGVSFNVIDLFNIADRRILVASPQLISLQNCYGFLKASLFRAIRDRAADLDKVDLFKAVCSSHETERVDELVKRTAKQDQSFAQEIERCVATYDALLLGNQLDNLSELNSTHALARMMGDFLSLKVPVVGGIHRDEAIHRSVTLRKPFLSQSLSVPAARVLLSLAEMLIATDVNELRQRASGAQQTETGSAANASATSEANGEPHLPRSLTPYQRAHERTEVDWPVEIQSSAGSSVGRILDFSQKGAKISWSEKGQQGDELLVTLVEQPKKPVIKARIVHVREDTIGVEFFEEIPLDAFEGYLQNR
jgi:flagellar biosynthesis protein FlhG